MKKISLAIVTGYVEKNIGSFHDKRLESLRKLDLSSVLKRKNPYLFRAKYLVTAAELVKALADAHLSSNEETIFGDWLECLAIFINEKVYNGRKSGISSIDLEFDKENIRYIVSIKSGPNWGNAPAIKKLKSDFNTAKKALRTSNSSLNVIAINGCCYGRDNKPDKGEYFKFCGQRFWEFISGDEELYTQIIEPLGNQAKERNEEFATLYVQVMNILTLQFLTEFCKENGEIDWIKIVELNSKTVQPKAIRKPRIKK
jgi:Type II restriction endonuclease EcoO109I